MRIMLLAFASVLIIAFVADAALDRAGFSTAEQGAGPNVRLD